MTEVDGQLELPYDDLPPPADPDALTAFLVVVDNTGAAVATAELDQHITVERNATLADMRRACMEVVADIAAMHTAEQVAQALQNKSPAPATRVRRKLQERGMDPRRPRESWEH